MTYAPIRTNRCERGHPLDGPVCFMCKQEDAEQIERDDKVLAALVRLVKRGKLSKEILGEK